MNVLKNNFNFISLNARGLKDNLKRKAIFLHCKDKNYHCVLLQETHSSALDATYWTMQWGDKILFSHGSNRSAGVAICFNKCPGNVISYKMDDNGHWLTVVIKITNAYIILTNVYGYNTTTQNKSLLQDITKVVSQYKKLYHTDLILFGGDFNLAPDDYLDRYPSKFNDIHYNPTLIEFCNTFSLIDIWRNKNPNLREYSWIKPNGAIRSRIDLWLMSPEMVNYVTEVAISIAPLTDHCALYLKLNPEVSANKRNVYWKLNTDLLKNQEYCNTIKDLMSEIRYDATIGNYCCRWEFFKFKVRQFSIRFGKERSKTLREQETKLIHDLDEYCKKTPMLDSDKAAFISLKSKLDVLSSRKARGAFIRSRAKWIEEGERNTAYFCSLEKRRQERNQIDTLMINDVECKDPKVIAEEVHKFYKDLYSSTSGGVSSLLDNMNHLIPTISPFFKDLCDAEIEMFELDAAVKQLSIGKSPGQDGLSSDFYKHFWVDIKDLFFFAIQECVQTKSLMTTMKQGLISLIPKSGKDKKYLKNLRPITLLNVDYKIFAHVIANRLKEGISQIISDSQSGFLRDRSIHNNIRLILDLLDYRDKIEDDGFILFLDFCKAFDSVEHSFMLNTLRQFGFGDAFCEIIQILYSDINSSVLLPFGTCKRFNIKRGIRQGCPASPLLFIMVVEILSIMIKNCEVKKLDVLGNPLSIIQLADDTTLFLKNEMQIPVALRIVNRFSEASGLHLNIDKCELMAIHDHPQRSLYDIPVKDQVKYLGIIISKNSSDRVKSNFDSQVKKSKNILNIWLQRDLSIFGRLLLSKMEGLSRIIYPAYSLDIPQNVIKQISQNNFNFIWKNRHHYIRKNDIVKSIEEGGLNAIDFDPMNGSLKLRWLQNFITRINTLWFNLPAKIFSNIGGIQLLLKCDYELSKLPIKLSKFHEQVLQYWKLIYKHNFTPHNTPIWNNRYILIKKKSFYFKDWDDQGIWSILHLMDDNGNLLNFVDFTQKYAITCTIKQYTDVINAIPPAIICSLKGFLLYTHLVPQMPVLMVQDCPFVDKKCNNKFLRTVLTNATFPLPLRRRELEQKFTSQIVKSIRCNYLKFPIPPKAKEVHFKILNDVYPSKEFLHSKFNIGENDCTFCNDNIETVEHLFFTCIFTKIFWDSFCIWVSVNDLGITSLSYNDIKFGTILNDKEKQFTVNNFIILAKFFVHKCKFGNTKPVFIVFQNDLASLKVSLKLCNTKKAVRLYDGMMALSFTP
uniref:Reverse transcriptase domain-containing protein n=2 Tax=Iconisemion striatum TaxID=60296 RepID=A0A1A7XB67_9TELE